MKLTAEHRYRQVLNVAEKLALKHGLYNDNLNYRSIANECGCSYHTVVKIVKNMVELRTMLIKRNDRLYNEAKRNQDPIAELTNEH